MAWLTTGMFRHTPRICLDNARTGHGGFVFSWLPLNELLSFHTFVTGCNSAIPRSVGMYNLTTVTASDGALFFHAFTHLCDSCLSALGAPCDSCPCERG